MNTIKDRQDATAWQKKHDALAPKAGEAAPDFKLYNIQGENPISLSESQGIMPTVLIFGSFT